MPPTETSPLSVVAFESRRCEETTRMLQRAGLNAFVSPSMCESPLDDQRSAIDFANELIAGQIDAVVLLTGVGTKMLVEGVARHVDKQRFLDALSDVPTIARGPKPRAALGEFGLKPTLLAPEPNTWRELLAVLDRELPVANLRVGLQEYGVTNASLIAGLEARGAAVRRVRVYDWSLPDDVAPLRDNIARIVDGQADIAAFTSAQQVDHLLKVAGETDQLDAIKSALRRVVIASIGPTTSERLRSRGIPVDLEASRGKLGTLVQEIATLGPTLVERKQRLAATVPAAARATVAEPAMTATTRRDQLAAATVGQPWHDAPFLKACRGEPAPYTPVWLMRQAGRYMREYREVRAQTSFLELCKNPKLCSEVMATAVDFLGVDAAIIFSDLLPILEPMGLDLEFAPGDGPVIHNPVREAADVERVVDLESVDSLHFVVETVRQTRADIDDKIPVIGFAGAPFTLASYIIEGGSSRNYLHTKTLMYRDEGAWAELMRRLARSVTLYLNAQIAAGAQAVQLFDSWVGSLGPTDYRRYVQPYVKELIEGVDPGVPIIHFGAGNPQLLPLIAEAGGDVIGVDWRTDLDTAWHRVGHGRAVQGNLEPLALLSDQQELRRRAQLVLDQAGGRPGHIFNLGHGIVPQTPPENARALVQMVHELSAR